MNTTFSKLVGNHLSKINIQQNKLIEGTVLDINKDFAIIDVESKSEGWVPIEQFLDNYENIDIKIGSRTKVVVECVDDGAGITRLSREKAKKIQSWEDLEKAYTTNKTVIGLITNKVKGGFTIDLNSLKAFLPGSLISNKPIHENELTDNKKLEFKIIKIDKIKNNIVLSRKAVLDSQEDTNKTELLKKIKENQILQGIVKNVTNYGAFIDLGGLDGLLHITDITWKRIKHPSEILTVGQLITTQILKFDSKTNRISLGMKQLKNDPWLNVLSKYSKGSKLKGAVTNITDYGCFVEIENGIEGLVHISEMDWLHKNVNPNKLVMIGTQIDVTIINIDEKRRRISLGIKQCKLNPWEEFAKKYKKGTEIIGTIKSITEFGIFIGLDGDIDGLIHLSDLTWDTEKQENLKNYKKGENIKTLILTIDPERERISLSIKHLTQDPFIEYIEQHPKGTNIDCIVEEINEKTITVKITDNIKSILKKTEILNENLPINEELKIGTPLKVKIIGIDKKTRTLTLSLKAKIKHEEKTLIKKINKHTKQNKTTLGDLIKQEINNKNNTTN